MARKLDPMAGPPTGHDFEESAAAAAAGGRIRVPWSVRDMIVATTMVVGSFIIFVLLMEPLTSALGGDSIKIAFPWVVAGSESVLLFAVWKLAITKHRVSWETLGLRSPRTRGTVLLVLAVLMASLLFAGIYTAVVAGLGIDALEPQPLPEELLGGGPMVRLLTAVAVAGWVPFVEELFFRGFLFQGLASRYGVLWGATVSSAVFAVAHLMIGAMIPIFVTGLLLAWVYSRTRSLWVPMAAHSAQNLLALIVVG